MKNDDDEVKSRKNAAENYDAINTFREVRPAIQLFVFGKVLTSGVELPNLRVQV